MRQKSGIRSSDVAIKLPCSSLVGWWGAWADDLQKVQSSSDSSATFPIKQSHGRHFEEKLQEFENEHFISCSWFGFLLPKTKTNSSSKVRDGKLFKNCLSCCGRHATSKGCKLMCLKKASVIPNTPTQQISEITTSFNKDVQKCQSFSLPKPVILPLTGKLIRNPRRNPAHPPHPFRQKKRATRYLRSTSEDSVPSTMTRPFLPGLPARISPAALG